MDEAAGPGTVGLQLDGPGTLRSRRLTAEALWGKPDEAGKTLRATDDDRQGPHYTTKMNGVDLRR
jgi:hypothetical protein